MKKIPFMKKTLQILSSVIFMSGIFLSCSVESTEISGATGSVIFDYSDETSAPENRLAVFIQTENKAQRTDYFKIENDDSGYFWEVRTPVIYQLGNKSYACGLTLYPPDGETVPKGVYKVNYYDASGNEAEATLNIDFNNDFIKSKSSDVEKLVHNKIVSMAIYDENNELIYFGKKKDNWSSNSAIKKEYKVAEKIRMCYSTPTNSIICFLPEKSLRNED